jgi:uncharacterized membrane protein
VRALDATYVVVLLLAVVAAPFFAVNWLVFVMRRKERRVFPMKSTMFFAILVVLGFVISRIATSIAQNQVRATLGSLSDACAVSINSTPVENRDEVLNTLRTFHGLPAHHSHPTHTIDVEIADPPRQLSLQVARDSENPSEYWIFVPSPSPLARKAALITWRG